MNWRGTRPTHLGTCTLAAGLAATAGFAMTGQDENQPAEAKTGHVEVDTKEGHQWPDAKHSGPVDAANREGKPQQWMTAPDDDLPEGFAEGDAIILRWGSGPQTLTPFVSRDAYASRIHRDVLEQLAWTDYDSLEDVPGLAKSWDVSEDGLTYTFHIFEHACFSDGHPVTADDVMFSWDLVMNEKIDAAVTRSYLEDNVESWEKIDDHTVRFVMKDVYFQALGIVGGMWILPKHIYGDFPPDVYNEKIRETCVGSGPWVVDEWEKGVQIVLKRNENYWGPKPALKKQIIRIVQSDLSALQDFKAGKIDIHSPTPAQWNQEKDGDFVKENAKAVQYFSMRGGYGYIGYNQRLPKFEDRRTRQAMTHLIDRQEIIDTIRDGLGNIVSGPFHFLSQQYNREIEPLAYDPDEAAYLLEEVGWEDTDADGVLDMDLDGDGIRDPFDIIFLMPSSGTYFPRLGRYVQDQFAQAGINVIIDTLDWSVFEQRLTERDFEMVSLFWTSNPEGDPRQIWHSSQAENRGSNYIGYKNPRVDELIDKARRTLDREKRMPLWHEVHRLIAEDQPYTFLFTSPSIAFVDNRYNNVRIHKLYLYPSEWYVQVPMQER